MTDVSFPFPLGEGVFGTRLREGRDRWVIGVRADYLFGLAVPSLRMEFKIEIDGGFIIWPPMFCYKTFTGGYYVVSGRGVWIESFESVQSKKYIYI